MRTTTKWVVPEKGLRLFFTRLARLLPVRASESPVRASETAKALSG
jgi:hypothetical protein